ncbi:olfactory receptor 4Q3-like [Eleutherodactylus coqui]|uniref:olfactory receptor 4Q3-like n=1 Tax=Eleutherodactylus coqui TaxID=57060 RepID=UPI003462FCAF
MNATHQQNVEEFTLLGLNTFPNLSIALFILLLIVYILILIANLLIMVTVYFESHLHSAMYYFLSRLSLVDLCYASVTVPKMLVDFLSKTNTVSLGACFTQLFFLHFFAGTECLLLTVMAYDRYVAICNPLRYSSIMNKVICCWLEAVCWVISFFHSIVQIILTCQLKFCGPNRIDHFFCDIHPLSVLSCSDIFIIEIIFVANSGLIATLSFIILLISYMGIINTVVKTRSDEGTGKAFSTCASHLIVVTLFFGPSIFIYMRPSVSFAADKMVSIFYTVLTPLLNPIIYTLRNKEAKAAIKSFLGKKLSWTH